MFSKDIKHHKPTPRTHQEAFGPYSVYRVTPVGHRHNGWWAVAGTVACGVVYGVMFFYGLV